MYKQTATIHWKEMQYLNANTHSCPVVAMAMCEESLAAQGAKPQENYNKKGPFTGDRYLLFCLTVCSSAAETEFRKNNMVSFTADDLKMQYEPLQFQIERP